MKSNSTNSTPVIIAIFIAIILGATSAIALMLSSQNPTPEPAASTIEIPGSKPPYNFNYTWAEDNPYVAHAFGGILGDSYTNSYEAFLLNYQLGHRVFEVDFFITDDGKTVAAHDAGHWQSSTVVHESAKPVADFTYADFMSSLWQDKYHPIDLNLLFRILQDYPDVYIVTDTKFTDEENVRKQFSAFVEAANEVDSTLLDHFIPQIYHPKMLAWIMDIYPWKSIIYTLYADPDWTPENVLTFAKESGVKCITLWDAWLGSDILSAETAKSWKSAGLKIATHTVNHYGRAEDSRARGADVVYTDFLHP